MNNGEEITRFRETYNLFGPFQEKYAIAHARAHTSAKRFRRVINCTRRSNFWQVFTTYLIKICACFHVLIIQTAVIDYLIKLTLIIVLLFWKLQTLHRSQKSFLRSPVYKYFKGMFVYRAPGEEKPAARKQVFVFWKSIDGVNETYCGHT